MFSFSVGRYEEAFWLFAGRHSRAMQIQLARKPLEQSRELQTNHSAWLLIAALLARFYTRQTYTLGLIGLLPN